MIIPVMIIPATITRNGLGKVMVIFKALFTLLIDVLTVVVASPFLVSVVWKDPIIKKATTTTMLNTSDDIAKPGRFAKIYFVGY